MLVLIILDGWGLGKKGQYNAIEQANTPQWDAWWSTAPKALLDCGGESAGLPPGQVGNSEVGHMHIGAGRVLDQDYTRINHAIETHTFPCPMLKNHQPIHVLGLFSPGGVHSHESHFYALLEVLKEKGMPVYLHFFLDGRDTPPRSAKTSLETLIKQLKNYPFAEIKSISGRYYAMDRDNRWDRVERVYNVLTSGQSDYHADNALQALEDAYARGENDEFVQPTIIGNPVAIQSGDTVFFMNYRADRARQLSRALIDPYFTGFIRKKNPQLADFITLTQYADDIPSTALFPPLRPKNTLGQCIAEAGLTQLRIAETEKYAHVTFFFNGGLETPFPHEDRVLIPSPKVATYDTQPTMSAETIAHYIVDDLLAKRHDVIIANFANADMVGHTGDMSATVKAIECLDQCLQKIGDTAKKMGVDLIITADHGNAECMYNTEIHQPHTSHTENPAPFLYISDKSAKITHQHGTLIDIAPTILSLLKLSVPIDMTGKNLLEITT